MFPYRQAEFLFPSSGRAAVQYVYSNTDFIARLLISMRRTRRGSCETAVQFLRLVELATSNHQARISVTLKFYALGITLPARVNPEAIMVLDWCHAFHFLIKMDHRCQQNISETCFSLGKILHRGMLSLLQFSHRLYLTR